MKTLVTAVVLVLGAAALAVPAAVAGSGGKPAFHERIASDAGVESDFCGSDGTVTYDGSATVTGWIGETGGDPNQLLKFAFEFRYTITNPETGAAVIDSSAGIDTNVIIAGVEGGVHTHEFTANGLRGKLQLANGRVLLRDAGSVTYRLSFDETGEFTALEIVSMRGPHTGFGSDEWCDAAIEALGL